MSRNRTTKCCLLFGCGLVTPVAVYAACPPGNIGSSATGGFQTKNGQIYGPNGQIFVAHGANVGYDHLLEYANNIATTLPGINFVRIPINPSNSDPTNGTYPSPLLYADAVHKLNAAGIVVEFENHIASTGTNFGSGQGQVFTGQMLANEQNFYSTYAGFFRDNPDVWFGTNNEPPANDLPALSNWQKTTYDTIRATGNNNPIMLSVNGWSDPTSYGRGYVAADYANMTNVVGDIHIYGWVTDYSTNQAAMDNLIAGAGASAQRNIPTASGPLPIIIGEYGDSTVGKVIDPNADQVLQAVANSGYGSAAWIYGPGSADNMLDGNGNLTPFGQKIAAIIKAGGGGCPGTVPLPAADPIPPVAYNGAVPPVVQPQQDPVTAPMDLPPVRQGQDPIPEAPVDLPTAPPPPEFDAPPMPPVVPFRAFVTPPININYNLPEILTRRRTQDQQALDEGANPAVVRVADGIVSATQKATSMINPIGTWLTRMDDSILVAGDAALQGFAPMLTVPVAIACLIFLGAKGVRFSMGDSNALPDLMYGCLKVIIVVSLSLNIGDYDYYVRDLIYTTLPNVMAGAISKGVATGVVSVASTIDALWAQSWAWVAKAWQDAGTFDFGTMLAAWFCAVTIGMELCAMALVYLLARLLLSVVLVFGPMFIACSLHKQTAPLFERWVGKCVALLFLQISGILVLVMVFAANKYFLDQINPYIASAAGSGGWGGVDGSPAPRSASDVQALTSMVIWVGMGAFALYSLPAIAYSIGTGVAVSFMPVLIALMAAGEALSGGISLGSFSSGAASSESLSLSLARDSLDGTSNFSQLPPPPPPSISAASPPTLGIT